MSFWTALFNISGGDKVKTGYQSGSPRGGRPVASTVNFDSAMTVSAFWASVRLLTEAVAAMPIKCYEIEEENSTVEEKQDYALWQLINYQPNRYQTRTEFIETLMLNLVTWGNSYIAIERSGEKIVSLMPLMSSQMQVKLLEDGELTYEYTSPNGDVRIFAAKSIWHIRIFGNGIMGMSPLSYARNALGIAIALEDRMTRLTKNGGKSTGVLMVDKVLSKEQREAVRANFAELEKGEDDQLFVLEAGMDYKQTSLSPSDMQLLENRRFEIEDIARFMGVPSVLINDTSATTTWGSGIGQITQGFYKLNLRPYLERIESSIVRNLMPKSDWGKISIEFDFDALLRADMEARYASASQAINSGLLAPNEARSREGLAPKEGGDSIYLNGSLVPAGFVNRGNQTTLPQ